MVHISTISLSIKARRARCACSMEAECNSSSVRHSKLIITMDSIRVNTLSISILITCVGGIQFLKMLIFIG